MRRILVAVDGFEPSLVAVKQAVDLAAKYDAEIFCLHVEEKSPLLQAEKDMESSHIPGLISTEPLKLVTAYANSVGTTVETIKTTGLVTGTILRTAQELAVDFIVIGDSARKRMDKLHFGSVAESVLKKSLVPVLIVKKNSEDIAIFKELAALQSKDILDIPIKQELAETELSQLLQKAWRGNFLLSFGFLAVFTLYYFTTAAINTTTLQNISTQLIMGVPLGLWMGFSIFPFALALCFLYLRMGR